ncbi:hypothetical protein [Sandaracinus amylolyticus]|uniref:hypothetical protein n=1 Tax=Sandaracinus amylolyticus TaxID=927083 RepID=UPI001F399EEF|nr:hypothetical protein [Sandaracinus amylolyticus]UJR85924.1 Hypothetical protein I5071_80040 [Sandaracinus amylolyticus]
MSSAIKPPGTGPTSGAPTDVGGATSAEGASDAFRAELEKAGGAKSAATGARADALKALAEEVRSGRIDASQAIDRLVERAMGGAAASLPPARRAELEAMLRAALEEDPTLAAMQRDLARGR